MPYCGYSWNTLLHDFMDMTRFFSELKRSLENRAEEKANETVKYKHNSFGCGSSDVCKFLGPRETLWGAALLSVLTAFFWWLLSGSVECG